MTGVYRRFRDIPRFPHCNYRVDVSWKYLEKHISDNAEIGLDLDPPFQRAHVWTDKQRSEYIEYTLMGGQSGRELYFNCPGFGYDFTGPYEIVDGKQRLETARLFMAGKVKAFGKFIHEYEDEPHMLDLRFSWNIAAIKERVDVLRWYVDFNRGGTPHSDEEIAKVEEMIQREKKK